MSSLKIKLDEVQVRAFKVFLGVKNKCYVACISHIFMRFFLYLRVHETSNEAASS